MKAEWEAILESEGISDLPAYAEPSASISIVRFSEDLDVLEYFVLADVVLVLLVDGHFKMITDYKHRKLDEIAKKELYKYVKQGMSLQEARTKITPILQKHRALKNTDEGYWVLSFDENAVDHAMVGGILEIKENANVLAMTDGLACAVEDYKIFPSYLDLISFLKKHRSFEPVYKLVRVVEEMDSNALLFPRLKKSDDASGVFFELEK